jgi:hypothetical protein
VYIACGSVVDPDPFGSALIFVGWIRNKEGKNNPRKGKKVKKFHVLKYWVFSFEV